MSASDVFVASLCVTIGKASVSEPFAAIEIIHISVAVYGIDLPFHFLVIRKKKQVSASLSCAEHFGRLERGVFSAYPEAALYTDTVGQALSASLSRQGW